MTPKLLCAALGLAVIPVSALAQDVTLAELDGTVVNVSAVIHQKIIRDGETLFPRLHLVGQVIIGPGEKMATSFQNTTRLPDGRTKVGPRRAVTFALGQVQKDKQGFDTVWLFEADSLVRLRVYGGAGGDKMAITFAKNGSALNCALSFPMMPEVGVGQIRKGSAVDGTPIQILEFKMISSTCKVLKDRPS